MESKQEYDTVSVAKSHVSKAPSQAPSKAPSVAMSHVSMTASQKKIEEEKQEAIRAEIRTRYQPIVDSAPKPTVKMVGLNPNMRPTASQSTSKIFPMQGLWSQKSLLKSTN